MKPRPGLSNHLVARSPSSVPPSHLPESDVAVEEKIDLHTSKKRSHPSNTPPTFALKQTLTPSHSRSILSSLSIAFWTSSPPFHTPALPCCTTFSTPPPDPPRIQLSTLKSSETTRRTKRAVRTGSSMRKSTVPSGNDLDSSSSPAWDPESESESTSSSTSPVACDSVRTLNSEELVLMWDLQAEERALL